MLFNLISGTHREKRRAWCQSKFQAFFESFGSGSFVPGGDVSNVGNSFTQYSFTLQATTTSTYLEFIFRNDASFFNLDNVSVELHPTGVPETGSGALLMALALAGLCGAQRILGRAARYR